MANHILVYGTLKQGYSNHHLLEHSKYVCTTITTDKYFMGSYYAFPIVLENNADYNIVGEIYEISDETLQEVDLLESNGTLYERKRVRVKDFDKLVWMYFIKNPTDFSDDGIVTSERNELQEWIGNKLISSNDEFDYHTPTENWEDTESNNLYIDDILGEDGIIHVSP